MLDWAVSEISLATPAISITPADASSRLLALFSDLELISLDKSPNFLRATSNWLIPHTTCWDAKAISSDKPSKSISECCTLAGCGATGTGAFWIAGFKTGFMVGISSSSATILLMPTAPNTAAITTANRAPPNTPIPEAAKAPAIQPMAVHST